MNYDLAQLYPSQMPPYKSYDKASSTSSSHNFIIEAFQDIVSLLQDQLKPLVLAEQSVLVDIFYKPETLFTLDSFARKSCENGVFILKLIKHTAKLMEEILEKDDDKENTNEKLCIKVLQTLKEMMDVDPKYDQKVSFFFVHAFLY